jgi:CheY-like chemotaxis protein
LKITLIAVKNLKIFLEIFGCLVLEAIDGIDAIECYEPQAPALILMDISMLVIDALR